MSALQSGTTRGRLAAAALRGADAAAGDPAYDAGPAPIPPGRDTLQRAALEPAGVERADRAGVEPAGVQRAGAKRAGVERAALGRAGTDPADVDSAEFRRAATVSFPAVRSLPAAPAGGATPRHSAAEDAAAAPAIEDTYEPEKDA
jgi:hypothetical protein